MTYGAVGRSDQPETKMAAGEQRKRKTEHRGTERQTERMTKERVTDTAAV